MRDARQVAEELTAALCAAVDDNRRPLLSGMTKRVERKLRNRDLEVVRQCLRLAQQVMNETPKRHQAAVGIIVDRLADLAIDLDEHARRVAVEGPG